MKKFENYHPVASLIYFLFILLVGMFINNPVIQVIALLSGAFYNGINQTKRENLQDLFFYLSLFIIITITNPIFSHNGVTPLFFLNGKPVTLEAIVFGASMAIMVISVMLWFKCFNRVITSDKVIYLFGKSIPKISIIITLSLRFIPLFKKQWEKTQETQKTLGLYNSKSVIDKIKGNILVISALISWSLDKAISTSTTMNGKGYGIYKRTNYSKFKFKRNDLFFIIFNILVIIIMSIGIFSNSIEFFYYPSISNIKMNYISCFTYFSYGLLAFMPFIIEVKENVMWQYYIRKI